MSDQKPPSLAAALSELQRQLPQIKKSETAEVQTQKGAYSYTYANLAGISAEIMPLLASLGLSFIAKPTFVGDRFVLAYSLLHVSGEREDGQYPLPTTGTPQAIGSAITYGRRYCLCAVTGIAPEDDDDGATAEAEALAQRGTAQRATRHRQATPKSEATQAQRARPPGEPPPLPGDDAANSDGITRPQVNKLAVLMSEVELTDRTAALAYVAKIVGRQVGSRNELTKAEASAVIDALEADKVALTEPLPDAAENPGFGPTS